MSAPVLIEGDGPVLLVCDHASAAVPPGIDLGVDADLMRRHIAVDIGADPLTRALAERLGAPAVLATVSRLVIDLNRQTDHPGLIPHVSDGHAIPGNVGVDRAERIRDLHAPFHRALAAEVMRRRPRLIVAIHSFTPALESGGSPRPWEAGVLYNRDTRAARLILAGLAETGLTIGDNEPYSGRVLNATLNRHAEARGIASASVEVRNDGISDAAGVTYWADLLAPILARAAQRLA